MPELLEEIDEIIDYAKGNFFPTSSLLKHALVVAKKVDDKEFEEFIIGELKGYKRGGLPQHRRIQGKVIIPPPYGSFRQVNLDDLAAEERRKVSTAYIGETIPVIESTINLQGDDGIFTVGFSPENEGVLPPLPNKQAEYAILLVNAQLKEMLDDVRTTVLYWAVKLHRERTKEQASNVKADGPAAKDVSGPRVGFFSANKNWLFEGIGTEAVKVIVASIVGVAGIGSLWFFNRQSDDGGSDRPASNSASTVPTSMPASEPALKVGDEAASAPAKYTFEQLRTLLEGKSKVEVKKLLGTPFNVSDYGNGNESWGYQNVAYDPLTGKVATVTVVSFKNGKVDDVMFG